MLLVRHTDDPQARIGRPRNDDIGLLKVGMADAEMTKGPRGRVTRDAETALQVVNVIRRRLLLVLVSFPPDAPERQQRLAELLQIRQFLVGCPYEHGFDAFV